MVKMNIIKKLRNTIPMPVKSILLNSNGWLVGSSIKHTLEDLPIKDYDILVTDRDLFQNTIRLLANSYTFRLNSRGGMNFTIDSIGYDKFGQELPPIFVDIWCADLSSFLTNSTIVTYLFNLNKLILLKNEDGK